MNITKQLEAIREELNKPLPAHLKETKMAEKKVKAVPAKKVAPAKKAPAKKEAPSEDNRVSLADLAEEAGISGQQARQKLRGADIEREAGKRWSWEQGSKALTAVRKALGL